jgi:hypothetical protein
MKRRDFITLVGGAAVAWPLAARAQQPAMPVVGFVRSTSLAPFQNPVVAFGDGLKEAGFVAGQNVAVESLCGESKRSPAGAGGGIAWHRGRRAGGEQRCSGRG